jgi:hypothetical protein
MQPLRRFKEKLDAVIIFSDILIVLQVRQCCDSPWDRFRCLRSCLCCCQAMGLEVLMAPGPIITKVLNPTDTLVVRGTQRRLVVLLRLARGDACRLGSFGADWRGCDTILWLLVGRD